MEVKGVARRRTQLLDNVINRRMYWELMRKLKIGGKKKINKKINGNGSLQHEQ